MLVSRKVWIAKPGKADALLSLMQAMFDHAPWPGSVRIYRNHIAPFDHVAVEMECESLAAFEENWSQWTAATFGKVESPQPWAELVEAGGTNEFWRIERSSLPEGD